MRGHEDTFGPTCRHAATAPLRRLEEVKCHLDDFEFHSANTVEGTLPTECVLREELEIGISGDFVCFIRRFEHVKRHTSVTPLLVSAGLLGHQRLNDFLGRTFSGNVVQASDIASSLSSGQSSDNRGRFPCCTRQLSRIFGTHGAHGIDTVQSRRKRGIGFHETILVAFDVARQKTIICR